MALKFAVDPEFPEQTLLEIEALCRALAALFTLEFHQAGPVEATITLDSVAMGGMADLLRAMAVASEEVYDKGVRLVSELEKKIAA